MSWPFQRISPAEGLEKPASIRRKVDLPDPLVPVRTRAPPSWRETFTCFRICWAFLMQETFFRRRRGVGGDMFEGDEEEECEETSVETELRLRRREEERILKHRRFVGCVWLLGLLWAFMKTKLLLYIKTLSPMVSFSLLLSLERLIG